MKKQALAVVTALNTVAIIGVVAVSQVDDGDLAAPEAGAATSQAELDVLELAERVEALEERLAVAEARQPASAKPAAVATPESPGDPETPTALPAVEGDPEAPVTRGELAGLVARQLDARKAAEEAAIAGKKADWKKRKQRPRRTIAEVSRELQLSPVQETQVRGFYQELERESIRLLFDCSAEELEGVKAQMLQAEHDPQLHAQLRERIAVNWARNGNELSALWVQLDQRLRRTLGDETTNDFYRSDVQLDQRAFPDVVRTFFPEKLPPEEREGE